MAKLKKLLEGIFDDRPQVNKYEVTEGVRSYGVVGKQLYNNGNILEMAKQLSHIAEQAHSHILGEQDDWFDKVSINKNMQGLKKNVNEFKKTAVEAHQLNQRLTGLYEDIGHVLNRYYEISEGEEGQLDQEPHHNNDGNVNDLDEGEEENNPPNQIGDEDPSEPNRKNSANVNEINKAMKETYDRISKKPTMRLKDIANNIVGLKPVGGLYKKNK
tara:strand:- start:41 stop:685 length:645 start_codon:yes stop_codon:yes gene_type:complete